MKVESRSARAGSSGQSLAETAVVLPLLLLLVFGIIEFGRVLNAYIIVTNGAREGARYGAVGYTQAQIINEVNQATASLGPVQVTVTGAGGARGSQVTVTVRYNLDIIVPLLSGVILPDPFPVTGTARMRIE